MQTYHASVTTKQLIHIDMIIACEYQAIPLLYLSHSFHSICLRKKQRYKRTEVTSFPTINMNAYKRADQNNVTTEASDTNGKKMFVSSLINHFHYAPITLCH